MKHFENMRAQSKLMSVSDRVVCSSKRNTIRLIAELIARRILRLRRACSRPSRCKACSPISHERFCACL